MTQTPGYGNRMIYPDIQNPAPGDGEFTLDYRITRREYSRGDYARLEGADHSRS